MHFLFHLGHPAHFHLFKNVIDKLQDNHHDITIAIKKKDVLENLLISSGLQYVNILPEGRKDNKVSIAVAQIKQIYRLWKICRRKKPDVLLGTSVAISYVGKILGIPSLNFNEDDAEIVPFYAKLAYPLATKIFAPNACSVGKWESKKVGYAGYHELAYLHPENFVAKQQIALQYILLDKPLVLMRFAKLGAHHDTGIKGISDTQAIAIIKILKDKSEVIITSERKLSPELEKYRRVIAAKDMHHVMAHARLFIGDSQTMAIEAGVLGVPFIRVNDFVGRIGILCELEEKYRLGIGIRPSMEKELIEIISNINLSDRKFKEHQKKKEKMLKEKVNLSDFIYKYLINKEYLKE